MKVLLRLFVIAALLAFIALILFTPTPTPTRASGPWYVATTGDDTINDCLTPSTPCATVNGALNHSADGDTIKVAIGTYTSTTGSEVVLLNRSATLSGGWDATFTTQSGMSTIDGQGTRRGLTVGGENIAISRFVVQNGRGDMGGGIEIQGGTLTINNSQITHNTASACCTGGPGGGGIYVYGTSTLTLVNSIVSANTLDGGAWGSGIGTIGTLALINSTVSGNTGGDGTGIWAFAGKVSLYNSTISYNQHIGIYLYGSPLVLQNSIISNNPFQDCYNFDGSVTSYGYNIVKTNGSCALTPTDLVAIDPLLGPLQDYGGQTLTHALLPLSPAINAGNPSGCLNSIGNPLTTDQRGFPRSDRCDIGAFEFQPLDSSTKTISPSRAAPDSLVHYNVSLSNPSSSDIVSATITDTIPVALTYVNGSLNAPSGSSGFSSGVITWTGIVNAHSNVAITYDATINSSTPLGTLAVNTANINNGQVVLSRSATLNIVRALYLPSIMNNYPHLGINGQVRYLGVPASGVPLELRFYNGSSWSTIASTNTASDGLYSFLTAPSLSPGQYYYVRYVNGSSDPSRLCCWFTRLLNSYTAGSSVAIGDFDIANIPLQSPSPGATVALPYAFQWGVRSATLTDSYEFDLFNPSNSSLYWYTPPLGYVGSYTLTGLPSGFSPGAWYAWYAAVFSPDGGYGESYYARYVMFSNSGASLQKLSPVKPRSYPELLKDRRLPTLQRGR